MLRAVKFFPKAHFSTEASSHRLLQYGEYLSKLVPGFFSSYSLYKDELCVNTSKDFLIPIMTFLRDHSNAQFRQVVDITAVDYPERFPDRFNVVYNLLSYQFSSRIRIKITADEKTAIPSVTCVFPGANWYEREVFDLFGISFSGHPDLRRILTDYGFEGHPLRKDFPLSGFVEVRWDEEKKTIVQEPVEMTQEFRRFDFSSPVSLACFANPVVVGATS